MLAELVPTSTPAPPPVNFTTFIIPTGQGHINKIFTKATLVFAYGLIKKGKNKKNPEVNVYL